MDIVRIIRPLKRNKNDRRRMIRVKDMTVRKSRRVYDEGAAKMCTEADHKVLAPSPSYGVSLECFSRDSY
jgi:hypothetical protein